MAFVIKDRYVVLSGSGRRGCLHPFGFGSKIYAPFIQGRNDFASFAMMVATLFGYGVKVSEGPEGEAPKFFTAEFN